MDPLWVQAGATVVLVGITIYYAYQVRKSNENAWVLEGNRRKREIELEVRRKNEEIDQLRKLIFTELGYNQGHIGGLLFEIRKFKKIHEKYKKDYKDERVYYLAEHDPHRDVIYRAILDKLGPLPHLEVWVIMALYTHFNLVDRKYVSITKDIIESSKSGLFGEAIEDIVQDINQLEEDILETISVMDALKQLYVENIDFSEFEKKIGDIWKKYEKFYSVHIK